MELLRFATAGSVDDGKSTLIGRLLYDSKSIFEDQLEAVERSSVQRGDEHTNLALLTDGLRAEREQGITIDVAYRYFATPVRKFIIADTPGHIQYTRNMVTGASTADLALVLVDARNGVVEQSRRHAFLAVLLGIPHIVLCVNKMDLVDWDRRCSTTIVEEFQLFATGLDVPDLTVRAAVGPQRRQRGRPVRALALVRGPVAAALPRGHRTSTRTAPHRRALPGAVRAAPAVRRVARLPGLRGHGGGRACCSPGDEVVVLPSGFTPTIASIDTVDGPLEEAVRADVGDGAARTTTSTSRRGDMICRAAQPARRSARTSTPWSAG